MSVVKSPEMQTNIGLAWNMGDVMSNHYWQEGNLEEVLKANGTIALKTDLEISDEVVAFHKARAKWL